MLIIGLCFFNLNLILIIGHVFIVIIELLAGLFMEFGKLTLLLAFGVVIFAITNTEWVSTSHAQVVPSIQSYAVPQQALTNNNAVAPFSLPSIKLDNNTNIAIAKIGPIAVAGPDQIVPEGSTVTLNGSESRDPNGVILSYSWKQIPTSHFITLSGADTPVWSFTAPRVSADTTLTFELTVTDNNGSTDKSTLNVLVKHTTNVNANPTTTQPSTANQPITGTTPTPTNQLANGNTTNVNANPTTTQPSTANQPITGTTPTPTNQLANGNTTNTNSPLVANAGPDKTVQSGASVALDGGNSMGNITSYSWKEVSGKSVKLTDANTAKAIFTAPSLSKDSTLKFKLTVNSGKDKTATATVNILVSKDNSKSSHSKG